MPRDLEAFPAPLMSSKSMEEDSQWPHLPSAHQVLCALKPWILTKSTAGTPKSRGPTAYLDGLRGFAAFLVYISHHILGQHMWQGVECGWGSDGKYFLINFPLFRNLFSGSHMAVHIFFVISGYVLTRNTIKNIHDGVGGDKIAASLASATCRRFVRLWTPVIVTTFVTMTIGWMLGHWMPADDEGPRNYLQEVGHWLMSIGLTAYPLTTVSWMDYNPHTWTIPYEFRGSMYVFLALLATHNLPKRKRMAFFIGFGLWCHYYAGWGCFTFMVGAFLAEVDLLKDEDWPQWPWLLFLQRNKTLVYCILIPFALHLGGQPMLSFGVMPPNQYVGTYGWYYLGRLIPVSYFGKLNDYWYSYGAIIMVTAVMNLRRFRALFEMRFTQYLGRISYGLYLVHGPVMFLLGERLYAATGANTSHNPAVVPWNNWWPISSAGPVGLEVNFLLPHVIMLPLTFYLAELCTKFIDEPSIKLSKNLYLKALAP